MHKLATFVAPRATSMTGLIAKKALDPTMLVERGSQSNNNSKWYRKAAQELLGKAKLVMVMAAVLTAMAEEVIAMTEVVTMWAEAVMAKMELMIEAIRVKHKITTTTPRWCNNSNTMRKTMGIRTETNATTTCNNRRADIKVQAHTKLEARIKLAAHTKLAARFKPEAHMKVEVEGTASVAAKRFAGSGLHL